MTIASKYSPEMQERAVRLVLEHQTEHESQWAAITSVAAKIGCTAETLRRWIRQQERDARVRPGPTTAEVERIKDAGARGPRAAASQRDPAQGQRVFCPGGARLPVETMIAFIDDHRKVHGIEPICGLLQIAPCTCHAHKQRQRDPQQCSARSQQNTALLPEMARVWTENVEVYGVGKVWRQLRREGFEVARCTVERLMKRLGLRGLIRGKGFQTTVSNPAAPWPLDHVQRQFRADRPNQL